MNINLIQHLYHGLFLELLHLYLIFLLIIIIIFIIFINFTTYIHKRTIYNYIIYII